MGPNLHYKPPPKIKDLPKVFIFLGTIDNIKKYILARLMEIVMFNIRSEKRNANIADI